MFSGLGRISKKICSHRWFSDAIANPRSLVESFGSSRFVLAGKVVRDPYIFENGSQSFVFRTEDTVYGYSINRVHTGMKQRVAAGQNLHIVGHLESKEFQNQNGGTRYEISARSRSIKEIGTSYTDINSVEITGAVLTDLKTIDGFSTFRVGTTFVQKSTTALAIPFIFQVRIYDTELCDSIRADLQKKPTIRLLGSLQSNEEIDINSKRIRSGYISASSVMIIKRHNKTHDDSERSYI